MSVKTPNSITGFSGTNLYSWLESGTARVKCCAQEHKSVMLPTGFKPRQPDQESSAITMRPLCSAFICLYFLVSGTGVTVYALHPGAVKSDIWRCWNIFQKPYVKPLVQLFMFLFFKDCKQGAQTTIYCSVAEELESISGLYYSDCRVKECNPLAKDPGLAKKLWDVSERVTGQSWNN